ncbi:MAG: S9 family peptidase [Sphingomonadaceae bacterium]|nr:S9 family peptidase [Sphingomonadaceae bacterium]
MTSPPTAASVPHTTSHHGVRRDDPYAWLRDPGYPKVGDPAILAHLAAENAWFDAWAAPHAGLIDTLFAELKGRVKDDDAGVPVRDGAWDYWWRFEPGGQYRVWLRRPAREGTPLPAPDDDAQVILSEPAEAAGKDYFRLAGISVSPDGSRAAWTADTDGSERFKLFVRDLATGTDTLVATTAIGVAVWAADGASLAWTEVNDQWRPFRVRLRRLGQGGEDAVLYEEADASFFVGLDRSTDRAWFQISTADHVTSEVRLIPTADPAAPPRLVRARATGVQYDVDVRGETLVVRTNDDHANFRLATAALDAPGEWTTLVAGSDRVYLRGVMAFAGYLALSERVDGLDGIRLIFADGAERRIAFPEASYTVAIGQNPEPDAPLLRLGYSSMVTPATTYDYDVAADRLIVRKVQDVPSGYDPSRYRTERLFATAADGTQVPVSVVYRDDFPRDGSGKVHLYGYGAYGLAIPPSFSASRLSLLDRGIAYAIAHVRGGDDMGYRWYLDGKLERRTNTFTDFVACARALIGAGFAAPGHVSISGGSAGGTLMGVVANTDPALWAAVVAHVPFVDVLGTMLDATLPLTPIEWPEWGNPIGDAAAYRAIAAYSPYDNVTAQAYPPMLVTAGLNDPRVTYWEPAKWVARLRHAKIDANPLLLKTNMEAGHGGKSGRWEALRETAEEYVFLLAAHGATEPHP